MEEKQDEGAEAQRDKIILIGDRGTGKTSFARSLSAPTSTNESSFINKLPIRLPTSRGEMILNIWDTGIILSFINCSHEVNRIIGAVLLRLAR